MDPAADELSTIPFRLPAPPQHCTSLTLVAGFVIAVYGFAASYCVATFLQANDGGIIIVAMCELVFFVAIH